MYKVKLGFAVQLLGSAALLLHTANTRSRQPGIGRGCIQRSTYVPTCCLTEHDTLTTPQDSGDDGTTVVQSLTLCMTHFERLARIAMSRLIASVNVHLQHGRQRVGNAERAVS